MRYRVGICVICGFLSSGCSFLFVTSPPANDAKLELSEPVECTTSDAAPLIDSAVTALELVRTAYALSQKDGDYRNYPISRTADVVFGATLATTFAVAAVYGFSTTSDCRAAKDAHARHIRKRKKAAPATSAVEPASSTPARPTPGPSSVVEPPTTEPAQTPTNLDDGSPTIERVAPWAESHDGGAHP